VFSQINLSGKINKLENGNIIFIQQDEDSLIYDTIKVSKEGKFNQQIKLRQPSIAYFAIDNPKASIQLFAENGINVNLQINIIKNKVDFTYNGDNKDCYDYMNSHNVESLLNQWPFERIDKLTFNQYRYQYISDVEKSKVELNKIKSLSFRRFMHEQIDADAEHNLWRYAWSKGNIKDPDFINWAESFDHNDSNNTDICESYLRWYSLIHKDKVALKNGSFYILKEAFTNQDIINYFADEMIKSFLKQAPEDMDQELIAYKNVSTNKKGWEEADKIYAHYCKMKKGAPAEDFEMTDINDRKYTLKDFRGKVLYIDCWASWCGPCCMEIPFMKKLFEHYIHNKDIEFISISLDQNKNAWVRKLKTDNPKWKQFICTDNFNSQLCKNYDIDAIPRFLMFDKQGNIISLDAPRPSDEDIISFIDSNIK
jgi:thiol-disulfide isomerase/thioredoxin